MAIDCGGLGRFTVQRSGAVAEADAIRASAGRGPAAPGKEDVGVAVGGATALYTMSLGAGVGAFIVFMVVIAVLMFGANAF